MLSLLLLLLAEALWIGVVAGERQQLERDLAALQQQQGAQSGEIEQLQGEVALRKREVSDIEQRVNGLRGEESRLREIINIVEREKRLSRSGFSPLLESLAYSSEEGAYLTEFHLLQGGRQLELMGGAMEADQLPRYINRLSAHPHFGESRVERLQLLHGLDTGGEEDSAATQDAESGWYAFRVELLRAGEEGAP